MWVAYRLFPIAEGVETHPRLSRWKVDDRIPDGINHDCYTNSGYDRGHNAPNSAIDTRYGRDAQVETFLMSNASPQTCGLNREPWQGLEHVVGNDYAMTHAEVFVISGPIFTDPSEQIACEIDVPVGFYKIVIDPTSGSAPRVLAIVMAQEVAGWQHRTSDFVTTVDCIEELTGVDFLADLSDAIEDQVESSTADQAWNLDQILLPTNYGCPGQQSVSAGNARRAELLAVCDD